MSSLNSAGTLPAAFEVPVSVVVPDVKVVLLYVTSTSIVWSWLALLLKKVPLRFSVCEPALAGVFCGLKAFIAKMPVQCWMFGGRGGMHPAPTQHAPPPSVMYVRLLGKLAATVPLRA